MRPDCMSVFVRQEQRADVCLPSWRQPRASGQSFARSLFAGPFALGPVFRPTNGRRDHRGGCLPRREVHRTWVHLLQDIALQKLRCRRGAAEPRRVRLRAKSTLRRIMRFAQIETCSGMLKEIRHGCLLARRARRSRGRSTRARAPAVRAAAGRPKNWTGRGSALGKNRRRSSRRAIGRRVEV